MILKERLTIQTRYVKNIRTTTMIIDMQEDNSSIQLHIALYQKGHTWPNIIKKSSTPN